MTNQTVKGTKDLLFDEWYKFKYIEQIANRISSLYGFLPVQTPIFEYTEVFTKTLGDSSDIINKEMYTFIDKGGKSITLRPEFTAAIVRLLIEKTANTGKVILNRPFISLRKTTKGTTKAISSDKF